MNTDLQPPVHPDPTRATAARAWYLLFAKPRQEHIAREHLQRQHYVIYLPLMREQRRRGGRIVESVEPMFPRYLFIQLQDGVDNWGPIRSTRGVSHLVQFGRNTARVPDALIELLKCHEDPNGVHPCPTRWEPAQGDRVRVVDGVARGYEGIVTAKTAAERVEILLTTVESSARLLVPRSALEKA